MSAPLSEQQLAEIAARTEAASAGPWMADGAEIYRAPYGYVVLDLWVGETLRIDDQGASNADAEFVAHAREDVPALLAEVARLTAELAKYVGHEPTLAEEALYAHEQQVRARIAQDVNRADKPTFAASENPELVVKTTRAIDIHLIEMGPAAPYWVPEAGDPR